AAYWEPVEDVVAGRGMFKGPVRAELELRLAVEPGQAVEIAVADEPVRVWWLVEGAVAASAVVTAG
ncbi:MAG: acyl-[acyl-carrier-protein] thioesterase, partial [Actinomycetota bacterium]